MKYTQAKPKAALFDLDGTLFDTDTANLLSYRDAFGSFGFVLTEQCWLEHCSGRCFKDFLPDIFDCTDETAKQIHMIKKKRYPLYLDRCVPNVSLFAVADALSKEMPLAVVTTASRKNTSELLGHFGYTDMFSLIVAQEDVHNAKPDPECYLYAFDKLGISPHEAIIFEDSPAGIEAARRSGGTVFIADNTNPIKENIRNG